MREIVFRGKSLIDGEWVEGYLNYAEQQDKYYIGVMELMTPVVPETVGQFTGLTDKTGNRIFEGDILKADSFYTKMTVIWRKDLASFALSGDGWMHDFYFGVKELYAGHCTITGNIHDK